MVSIVSFSSKKDPKLQKVQNTFCWNQTLYKFHIASNNLSFKRDITYTTLIDVVLSIFLCALPLCLVSRASSTRNNCPFCYLLPLLFVSRVSFSYCLTDLSVLAVLLPLNSSEVVEYQNYVDRAELRYLWGNYWSNFWGVFWICFWCDLLEIFLDVFLVACCCNFRVNYWRWVAAYLGWINRKSWEE